MKTRIAFLLPLACVALLMCGCPPKPTTVTDSPTGQDSGATGGVRPLPPADDTLMPTGGIKPLPTPTPGQVQSQLLQTYSRGEIDQCEHKGAVVYKCSRNAPDAGSEFYDAAGNRIGRCYYSTRVIDPICNEATACKTIYRMAGNIWGKPEVVWVKPQ